MPDEITIIYGLLREQKGKYVGYTIHDIRKVFALPWEIRARSINTVTRNAIDDYGVTYVNQYEVCRFHVTKPGENVVFEGNRFDFIKRCDCDVCIDHWAENHQEQPT